MAKVVTRKIGLEMDAQLYAKLSKVAEQNGQSRRFLLERAVEHYLEVVVPSQSTVRPEVIKQFRRSTEKNRKLYQLLAQ
jgi:predicted transcriptional regulator